MTLSRNNIRVFSLLKIKIQTVEKMFIIKVFKINIIETVASAAFYVSVSCVLLEITLFCSSCDKYCRCVTVPPCEIPHVC